MAAALLHLLLSLRACLPCTSIYCYMAAALLFFPGMLSTKYLLNVTAALHLFCYPERRLSGTVLSCPATLFSCQESAFHDRYDRWPAARLVRNLFALYAVLRIRIRKDLHNFAGSTSATSIRKMDPDPTSY
jgi:hypothetical protein